MSAEKEIDQRPPSREKRLGTTVRITLASVWTWMNAGCNENEIAAYGKFSRVVAKSWMVAARKAFVNKQDKQDPPAVALTKRK